jgi:hypothetical protein
MVASDLLVVDFAQENNVLKLYPEAPIPSSDRAGWNGIQLNIIDFHYTNLTRTTLSSIALSSTIAVFRRH